MIVLAVVLAGLAVLTAAAVSGHRWPLWARVPLVAAAPWLAFAAFQLSRPESGWPTSPPLPAGSALAWGIVDEPDALTHDPGHIDIWAIPPGSARPRAYRFPYTRQLHKQLQQALNAVKRGEPVAVRKPGRPRGRQHAGGSTGGRLVFYRMPPPALPAKR